MNRVLLFIASAILITACKQEATQTSSSVKESDIDTIFREWDHRDTPGVAVAVMKEGKVIFKKGYGMANLEYDIPNTSSSIFHIASESKQYTAFCIVLLARQGKLSLDDDVRKYLPFVPDFKQKITIKNLIHHTSGMRDQWQLLAIQGTRLEDVITTDHVLKLVANQKDLNFNVGSRSLYCNTGYTLLAQIVQKVSGQSFRNFADSAIFKPLGMKDTHFHDDNTELVKGRTYSYDFGKDKKYIHAPLNYAVVGATSLFTTVEDELKWVHNYETAEVGGKEAIDQMFEQGVLTNGKKLDYAFALNIGEYKGHKEIGHGGGDAGYRTYAVRYPDQQLCIAVFCNLGSMNPTDFTHKVADLYLPKKDSSEDKTENKAVEKSIFKNFEGHFTSEEGPALYIHDSTKQYVRVFQQEAEVNSLSDTSFSVFGGYATFFSSKTNKPVSGFKLKLGDEMHDFVRFEPSTLTSKEIDDYVGTYENDELDSRYQIVNVNGKPVFRHSKYPDAVLTVVTKNQFTCGMWWMSNLNFTREGNKIVGFEMSSGRVLHLRFKKL